MPEMQQTIKEAICFSGSGIHTGVTTNMTLKPSKENSGIRFVRIDLKNHPEIKADISNVCDTDRSTSLKKGEAEIHTVEHILAAITGAEIDNIIIEVDNLEIPILDGSAKEFSNELQAGSSHETAPPFCAPWPAWPAPDPAALSVQHVLGTPAAPGASGPASGAAPVSCHA